MGERPEPHGSRLGSRRGRGWPSAAALVTILLASLGGCAGPNVSRAAEARLLRDVATARCEKTLDEAWDEARRLLAERGYPLAGSDARAAGQEAGLLERAGEKGGALGKLLTKARETRDEGGGRVLETAWSRGRRYRLEGAATAPGCRVAFLAIREDPYQPNRDRWEAPQRDARLELELLRRLAPDEAARIEPPPGDAPSLW